MSQLKFCLFIFIIYFTIKLHCSSTLGKYFLTLIKEVLKISNLG